MWVVWGTQTCIQNILGNDYTDTENKNMEEKHYILRMGGRQEGIESTGDMV